MKPKKESTKDDESKDSGEITERDFKDPKIVEFKVVKICRNGLTV